MNRNDVIQMLTILKANYPSSFRKLNKEDYEAMVSLYEVCFKEQDVRVVSKAIYAIITNDTREFAPNVGQIMDKVYKLQNPTKMSEQEAWQLVLEASKNGIYHSKQEFDKLPKAIKRVLGSPETLQQYAMIDVEQLNTVIASNFMRSYKAVSKELEDYDRLPNQIKSFISSITDSKKLVTDDEDTKKLEVSYEVIRTIPKY